MRTVIELTTGEITIIEDAITAIKGVFDPKLVNIPNAERQSERKMGLKNTGYVNGIYEILDANSGIIPSSFDMGSFTMDRNTRVVLSGFFTSFATITEALDDSTMVMGHQNMGDADAGLELIKSEAKHNSTIKTVLEEFLAGHKSPRSPATVLAVPAGGSATIQNVRAGTRFTNRGTTVYTIFNGASTTGGIDVGPGDSTLIPEGWHTIRIVNNSATTAGAYTLA